MNGLKVLTFNYMKKLLLLAATMLLTIAAFAETIPANDSRVTYVGRTLVEGTDVSFDWTATYFRIAFSGKSLTMRASESKWDADRIIINQKRYF